MLNQLLSVRHGAKFICKNLYKVQVHILLKQLHLFINSGRDNTLYLICMCKYTDIGITKHVLGISNMDLSIRMSIAEDRNGSEVHK